jgi:acyl-CoA reductase-like NAD-dependent aldehyde dehydrogenase
MENELNFYIDGAWVPPVKAGNTRDVINPATEKPIAKISMGTAEDVDKAVKAARRAFESYSRTTPAERIALMQRIMAAYQAKYEEMAKTISSEMGAPIWLSKAAQAAMFMAQSLSAVSPEAQLRLIVTPPVNVFAPDRISVLVPFLIKPCAEPELLITPVKFNVLVAFP